MSWLRLDDGVFDHPKILELAHRGDRYRWFELLGLCARYRTRGAVTPGMLRGADIGPKLRKQLLELRLLEPAADGACTCEKPDECADGLHVHDWPRYNPPADPTGAVRQARYRAKHRTPPLVTPKPSPPDEPQEPSRNKPERNALHPVTPVTPPVPVPLEEPPKAPLPPAGGGTRGIDDGRLGGAIGDELERLRRLAGDAPEWTPEDVDDPQEEGEAA